MATNHETPPAFRYRRKGSTGMRRMRPGVATVYSVPKAPGPPPLHAVGGADFFTAATGRPAVIGHRGSGRGVGPGDSRENTVRALRTAAEMGADWVEIDVQLSADGDLVLSHDVVLDGKWVCRYSTRELLRRGLHTLEEAHEKIPSRIGFNIEIKVSLADLPGEQDLDLFAHTLAWAEQAQQVRPLLVTSFCPTLFTADARVPLGWLTQPDHYYFRSVVSTARLGGKVVGLHAQDVLHIPPELPQAEEVMAALRRLDVAVLAWGVEPHDVATLANRGVTGMIGDNVAGLVAAVLELPAD